MNWFISVKQFEDLATARPDPPYVLLFVGLFITLTCAIPFVVLIRQRIDYWAKNLSASSLPVRGAVQVILPFSGMMGGICIFIASALEVFGVPVLPAFFVAVLLVLLSSYLAWWQLGRVLSQKAVRRHLDEASDFPSHQS
ncbi:hypothetical protein [Leptolyngbya sp. NIES-2104]|uniref:hypothetical protein n=1 Tax=Leptolyngbya sp. NIES-2104 TaxID=1552121 RepID=UPI0006EC4E66|nr:hypothetical protein [Leptolyngbya sp. NIES-2104]GAP93763.1 hypothetical protein NIES2104_02710 [Leptolyngbya sp. NIES-2104]